MNESKHHYNHNDLLKKKQLIHKLALSPQQSMNNKMHFRKEYKHESFRSSKLLWRLLVILIWLECVWIHHNNMHVVSGLHMASPTSIVYTGNGITAVVGFITDVNDDHLLDFVVAYYQRDYNFASQVVSPIMLYPFHSKKVIISIPMH